MIDVIELKANLLTTVAMASVVRNKPSPLALWSKELAHCFLKDVRLHDLQSDACVSCWSLNMTSNVVKDEVKEAIWKAMNPEEAFRIKALNFRATFAETVALWAMAEYVSLFYAVPKSMEPAHA